jgi:predicted TIM-barrel fold metal-dependent hydrolase
MGACLCASGLHARSPERPWRIDVHHHYGSPAYTAFGTAYPSAGLPPSPPNDIQRSLADMEQSGTALAVLSSFVPATGGTAADRRALARAINEHGAGLVQRHPGRFALFPALPLPDVDASLGELAYGLDALGAVGATVYTEAAGKYLGDPAFAPLMEELDRRAAVLFVHPHTDACCGRLVPGVPDSVIEFGTSTTRCIASLLFGGAVDRYPRIRFVFSHGGGTMPFLIERFLGGARAEIVPGITTVGQSGNVTLAQPKGGALAALRRFHYDTAQIANPVALRALAQVVPASRILYGTDSWFRSSVESAGGLEDARVFGGGERRAIGRDNALALIPSLVKTLG